jgi:hypothetical protein
MTFLPVGAEPVKEMRRTFGCEASKAPVEPAPEMMLRTPGGKPASAIRGARARDAKGAFSEALYMRVLPAARAPAMLYAK